MWSLKQKNKKILVVVIVLVLVVAGIYYWARHSSKPNVVTKVPASIPANTVNYGPPSTAEKQAGDQQKQDVAKQQDQAQNGVPPAGSVPQAQTITIAIARASQSGASQPLAVRANITGTTTGECDITFSKNGQTTFTRVFPITIQATTSSCQGADIAASDFSINGDWTLQIVAKNGLNQSPPATQTVTVTK
jgi:hypothetical protein